MAIVGLQVVTKDGGDVGSGRALLRTLVLPLSVILLGIGILTILVSRNRRALHDIVAGTAVVYSWNARAGRASASSPRRPATGDIQLGSAGISRDLCDAPDGVHGEDRNKHEMNSRINRHV